MSNFFKSEQVQDDLQAIFSTYQQISAETSRLGTMDREEKLEHIEDCKGLIDKQKTFYFRLTLAAKDDPEAADMKERINALSNAFGFKDLMDCMDCMIKTLEDAAKRG